MIGERNLQEATKVYEDYDMVVRGIKAEIFIRNRDSCDAFGQICAYKSICDKCLTPEQEELAIEKWKEEKGE